jgi:UDP-N-acetylglucosamine acyltransferase
MSQTQIDPTASVHPGAKIGERVIIGPRAVIEDETRIGDRCRIGVGAVIKKWTDLGADNLIKEYAVLGGDPQHTAYKGEPTGLRVGSGNMIGEFVTFHRAYMKDASTVIGDKNYFMAYTHVGHDCVVGDHCVMTNYAALAGHTEIEDRVLLAGYAATHQFTRVGTLAMLAGDTKISKDAVPYMMYLGAPGRAVSVNIIGMRRNGVPEHSRTLVRHAFRILFRSDLSVTDAVKKIREEMEPVPEILRIIEFIDATKRGIAV